VGVETPAGHHQLHLAAQEVKPASGIADPVLKCNHPVSSGLDEPPNWTVKEYNGKSGMQIKSRNKTFFVLFNHLYVIAQRGKW